VKAAGLDDATLGPRQRVICSLGALAPAPKDEWLGLARKLHASLAGQGTLLPDAVVDHLVERVRPTRRRAGPAGPARAGEIVEVQPDQVAIEEAREAGPVHVGHQMWRLLTLDAILAEAGLSERARRFRDGRIA